MTAAFLSLARAEHPLVALLLIGYFEIANRDFLLTNASLENLSQFIAPVAIIAFGEIMLMIGGEIDLSAGMVFAFAPFMHVVRASTPGSAVARRCSRDWPRRADRLGERRRDGVAAASRPLSPRSARCFWSTASR